MTLTDGPLASGNRLNRGNIHIFDLVTLTFDIGPCDLDLGPLLMGVENFLCCVEVDHEGA